MMIDGGIINTIVFPASQVLSKRASLTDQEWTAKLAAAFVGRKLTQLPLIRFSAGCPAGRLSSLI